MKKLAKKLLLVVVGLILVILIYDLIVIKFKPNIGCCSCCAPDSYDCITSCCTCARPIILK